MRKRTISSWSTPTTPASTSQSSASIYRLRRYGGTSPPPATKQSSIRDLGTRICRDALGGDVGSVARLGDVRLSEQHSPWMPGRARRRPPDPPRLRQRTLPVPRRADVPPVRLHDLRHGAASLAHEAGADLTTLQDLLGHSSIVITADAYTSVLPLAQRKCADATAKLVLAADRRTREKIRGKSRRNRRNQRPAKGAPTPARLTNSKKPQVTPPTTRTASRSVTTPPPHPRDTHRPQGTETTRGLNRVSAAQAPDDQARPKGLEPLTF